MLAVLESHATMLTTPAVLLLMSPTRLVLSGFRDSFTLIRSADNPDTVSALALDSKLLFMVPSACLRYALDGTLSVAVDSVCTMAFKDNFCSSSSFSAFIASFAASVTRFKACSVLFRCSASKSGSELFT